MDCLSISLCLLKFLSSMFYLFLKKKIFFNVYLFLRQRETQHEWGRGRERGRHRIGSRLQALSHQPRARRGAQTRGPRDRDLSWSRTLNWLSHPGAPNIWLLILTQVMTSGFLGWNPYIRLCTDSMEPAWDSFSLSLCPSPAYALSLSLKINKLQKIIIINKSSQKKKDPSHKGKQW